VRGFLRLVGAGTVLLFGNVNGAILVVDRLDDDPTIMACTDTALDCTLRGAVLFAELSPGPDEIVIPADTFELTVSGAGDAQAGDLEVSTEITIRGAGAENTIITPGALFGVQRAFEVTDGGQLTLEDLALVGFGIPDNVIFVTPPQLSGGAIFIDDALENQATLRRVRLAENRSTFGGAITLGSTGDPDKPIRLTIVDSTIEANSVDFPPNTSCVGGALLLSGHARLERTVVQNNVVDGANGGAICLSGGELTANDLTLSANQVSVGRNGAGIYSDGGIVDLDAVRIDGHTIIGGSGAAIYIDGGSAVITDSELINNRARGSGVTVTGGAEVDWIATRFDGNGTYQMRIFESTVTMADTHFVGTGSPGLSVGGSSLTASGLLVEGHRAERGGGLIAQESQVFLSDCTFRNNRAEDGDLLSGFGGAMYIEDGFLQLLGCTLHDNEAITGGGGLTLDGSSFSVLRNSTFSNNQSSSAESIQVLVSNSLVLDHLTMAESNGNSQIRLINSSVAMANNAIDGFCNFTMAGGTATSNGGNVVNESSCDLGGVEDRLVADLGLLGLGSFGGSTPTHLPMVGSALIDNASTNCATADQRGAPRGSPCASGSVERGSADEFLFSDGFE